MRNNKIAIFFCKMNYFVFIMTFFLLCLLLNFLLIKILPDDALRLPDLLVEISQTWIGWILIVIIGPAFETSFFQMIPISSVRALISKETPAFITSTVISALTFAIPHGIYSKYYMLYALIGGVVLAITYNLSIYRKESPFLSAFIVHALWNLFVLLLLENNIL